jgi:hypothetical protein
MQVVPYVAVMNAYSPQFPPYYAAAQPVAYPGWPPAFLSGQVRLNASLNGDARPLCAVMQNQMSMSCPDLHNEALFTMQLCDRKVHMQLITRMGPNPRVCRHNHGKGGVRPQGHRPSSGLAMPLPVPLSCSRSPTAAHLWPKNQVMSTPSMRS